MVAKHVVIQGSRIQIGSGQHILIGKDPWLPDMDNGFITTNLNEDIATAPVSSLMMSDQRRWDYDIVADIFDTRDKDLILQIPLSNRRNSDVWYWLADPRGSYSVCSCYKMQSNMTDISPSCIWRQMWRLEVPGKQNVTEFLEILLLEMLKLLVCVSPNGFGLIIEECRALAHSLGEVQFSFVRRSANTAAHNVARVGGSLSGPGGWSHVPPPWLINAFCLGFVLDDDDVVEMGLPGSGGMGWIGLLVAVEEIFHVSYSRSHDICYKNCCSSNGPDPENGHARAFPSQHLSCTFFPDFTSKEGISRELEQYYYYYYQ
ncbi:hypothetical protein MRB53_007521 [Persea americana]|uniref:Uncharacterized protein n=1 Tax=Persea americana TaxID=3435 RepID=A0ACC2MJE5_PERAE|nr:hypothetical protein MRB53_007521 [Persea americana]